MLVEHYFAYYHRSIPWSIHFINSVAERVLICAHKTWRKLTQGVSGYFNRNKWLYDVDNNKEPWLRKILTKKILWSVVMTLPFLLHAEIFAIMFCFQKTLDSVRTLKKIVSMTNNITCINYFRRYFQHSKLVGCTTGVFPSRLSIHVSYGEASILLQIWKRGKSCSWSWPHHVPICLTTEPHGRSYVRKHLRWRLSC